VPGSCPVKRWNLNRVCSRASEPPFGVDADEPADGLSTDLPPISATQIVRVIVAVDKAAEGTPRPSAGPAQAAWAKVLGATSIAATVA
jgi:hypothetical protein